MMDRNGKGLCSRRGQVGLALVCSVALIVPVALRQLVVHNGVNYELLLTSLDEAHNAQFIFAGNTTNLGVLNVPPALPEPDNKLAPTSLRKTMSLDKPPDGTFNGLPVYYNPGSSPIHSTVHCVGHNYQQDSWKYRSCAFRHLCFDTDSKSYVIFRSDTEKRLEEKLSKLVDNTITAATVTNTSVAIGGMNPKWNSDMDKLKWFPFAIQHPLNQGYYELDPAMVLVPFHSLAGFNAGHLLWDDFFAIFTLLSIFRLEDKPLMLMRYILPAPLWATCDFKDNAEKCDKMMAKFLPAMGIDPSNFRTSNNSILTTNSTPAMSNLVCANYGAAGIGMIQDHGMKLHGWVERDYQVTYNIGRSASFYRFHKFLLQNLGIQPQPLRSTPPYKITFSIRSSKTGIRNTIFSTQIVAVKRAFREDVTVQSYIMSKLSVAEQAQITADTAIYITACGGGTVTATFLSPGSSLIVYYDEKGGLDGGRLTFLPARLDWDLLNNAYFRTHWMPLRSSTRDITPNSTRELNDILVHLIAHELDVIKRQQ